MNILVIGRGWTGNKMYMELTRRGHSITFVSHMTAFHMLENNTYDWVVNAAGVTGVPNVDACEDNKLNTYEGNALYPIQLSRLCEQRGIRFSHFSSGCIYEGTITDVRAKPNFFGSTYSISKGISDSYLLDKAQVYRIRMPFTGTQEQKNTLCKILHYAKTGKLIEAGQNSLTDLDEAVSVACDLIEQGAENGPYNLVNAGSVNMHEMVELLGINADFYTDEEFKLATKAGRSTCTIPHYEKMSSLRDALTKRINELNN